MSPTVINPRPVPLFELATQYQAIRNEVEAAVREVLESQQYTSGATSGPFVGRFEEHLGVRLGAHVVALSSGTDAILAALMALAIGAGDEVICRECPVEIVDDVDEIDGKFFNRVPDVRAQVPFGSPAVVFEISSQPEILFIHLRQLLLQLFGPGYPCSRSISGTCRALSSETDSLMP